MTKRFPSFLTSNSLNYFSLVPFVGESCDVFDSGIAGDDFFELEVEHWVVLYY